MLLMAQGRWADVGISHLLVAAKTGALAVFPVLGVTLTAHARHLANRWTSSGIIAICAFMADVLTHESNYPGKYLEAILTAIGTFLLSVFVSYTRLGRYTDALAEEFLPQRSTAGKDLRVTPVS
jgi:hypothetical protein